MTPEDEASEQRVTGTGAPNDRDEFDEAAYLEINLDVAQEVAAGTYTSGREHWDRYGHSEGRVATRPKDFDELLYLDLNPDVLQAVLTGKCPSGYYHWLHHGKAEGRLVRPIAATPSDWNETQYLRLNPNVADMIRTGIFASGYEHWVQSGFGEGRPGGGAPHQKTPIEQALQAAPIGINMFAFHQTPIGLGAAARGYADILSQMVPLHLVDIPWGGAAWPETLADDCPYAINLVHVNPETLPNFLGHGGQHALASRFNVGIWIWELHGGYAPWHALSRYFNEIWTASAFSATAIQPVSTAPVHVIPYVIDEAPLQSAFQRGDFGLDKRAFLFLYIFDPASSFDRKNPLALIRAFRKAFGERRDVQLVLKYHHAEADPAPTKLIERLVQSTTNIRTISETFSKDQLNGLLDCCDCFVSPHRSEGLGLNIAAAMLHGKPVIATGYSGNMDFTTPENAFLIEYDLVALEHDSGIYKTNFVWAEPSEDYLAQLLRTVVEAPEAAQRRADLGRRSIQERYSRKAVSEALRERLKAWGVQR